MVITSKGIIDDYESNMKIANILLEITQGLPITIPNLIQLLEERIGLDFGEATHISIRLNITMGLIKFIDDDKGLIAIDTNSVARLSRINQNIKAIEKQTENLKIELDLMNRVKKRIVKDTGK